MTQHDAAAPSLAPLPSARSSWCKHRDGDSTFVPAGRRRSLLVVAAYYPPVPSIGSARWEAMTRHLSVLGYEVTVLTTSSGPLLAADGEEPDWPGVVRAPDLRAVPWLRKTRPPLAGLHGAPPREAPEPARLARAIVPDVFAATWAPFALGTLRRLIASQRFDCLVTSSPPESAHLLAMMAGDNRPAWLADFRDGWTFDRDRFRWPPQRRVDGWLEGAIVGRADDVVAATRPIAEDLASRLGIKAAWVPNGWDPALEPATGAAEEAGLEADAVNVLHTGKLGGSHGRSPQRLLEGLARLRSRDPVLGSRLRLVLAGPLQAGERRLIERSPVADVVRCIGSVTQAEAIALQRRANALLIVTSPHGREATGKIYEYLAAERPIVALTGDSEAARIVRETGTGICVPPDDAVAIADALAKVARGDLERRYAPRGTNRFTYPAPARSMAERIETAISRRAGRRGRARAGT